MQSHFTFSKQQRSGIFLLVIIIVVLQSVYFYIDNSSNVIVVNDAELLKFQNEIDSLKLIKLKESKVKLFSFNPNYITDYKGASIGMSNEEIDRLLNFRKKNKWINSSKQFQEVTKVSDSLLNVIIPYFKFPEWVINKKTLNNLSYNNKQKTFTEKLDLNTATAEDLQRVNGIGKYYSERIIKFRNSFPGGFIADIQLQDVYGLKPDIITGLTSIFTVKTPRLIKKINLNTATVDELVRIQHIDYDIANRIVEQRILLEGYNSINDLTKVKDFPVNKIEIIELYLHLEKEN